MPKPTLRRQIQERLRAIPPEERTLRSQRLCRQIASRPEWEHAQVVALFAPLRTEPDLDLLWSARGERRLCYPRVEGERLLFHAISSLADLCTSVGRLREPHVATPCVAVSEIDLLLVPGVAFTTGGYRMGRGGGYYDRFLTEEGLRSAIFGVCFQEQMVESLPLETHDRPVEGVWVG